MVENASPKQGASLHRRLDPDIPQPQRLERSGPPDDETPRDKRRREWHNNKIEGRREKQRQTRGTSSAASGNLMGLGPAVAETENAPLSAYADHVVDHQGRRPHDRTPDQWKTIQKLQLCAKCMTRTVPPHKPNDEHAPCKDSSRALFDEAYISAIRKGLARDECSTRRASSSRRKTAESGGRDQQTRHARHSSNGGKNTLQASLEPKAGHGYASHRQQTRLLPRGEDAHGGSVPYAPLYNFPRPSSFHPDHTMPFTRGIQNKNPGTESQSSFTLAHLERVGLGSSEPPQSPGVLHLVNKRQTTPPGQSVSEIDILGIDPVTPLIPEIQIDGEAHPLVEKLGRILPQSGIGRLMHPVLNHERDWDSITNVAEVVEQAQVDDTVDGDLNLSGRVVEKLIAKAAIKLFAMDRSWTLKGLCPSPNPSDWDDATMVEEPQEFSPHFNFYYDKVLRPSQSVESFFATRQGMSWLDEEPRR